MVINAHRLGERTHLLDDLQASGPLRPTSSVRSRPGRAAPIEDGARSHRPRRPDCRPDSVTEELLDTACAKAVISGPGMTTEGSFHTQTKPVG